MHVFYRKIFNFNNFNNIDLYIKINIILFISYLVILFKLILNKIYFLKIQRINLLLDL